MFALTEAKDISDALILLLGSIVSDLSLSTSADSGSTSRQWFEGCTERDVSKLRLNLVAVLGIIMSTRSISVNNRPSRYHAGLVRL